MRFIVLIILIVGSFVAGARATMIPRVSVEQLVDQSDSIVTGRVIRSWTGWDPAHQYIWTHTEIQVSSVTKGPAGSTMVVSEPGGQLDGRALRVDGAVQYSPGEQVLLFVANTPNGYQRTVGWGQGKFLITPDNRIHATASAAEFVDRRGLAQNGTSARGLDGALLSDARARVTAQLHRKAAGQ